jgi:hypothetical protein
MTVAAGEEELQVLPNAQQQELLTLLDALDVAEFPDALNAAELLYVVHASQRWPRAPVAPEISQLLQIGCVYVAQEHLSLCQHLRLLFVLLPLSSQK